MVKTASDFTLSVPVTFFREGKSFVAYSPVLDLSTSGRSFAQAQKRFLEAVQIFFEETSEKGMLDQVLANLGWTKIRSQWRPPFFVSHRSERVKVPLHA